MNRVWAALMFVFGGGLLIFASPYLLYQAAINRVPWSVPIIVIPMYALLSYGAFKLYWSLIIKRGVTSAPTKTTPRK